MTFHPDGRTLFCGLDDNLKCIKCHDVVDIWWSTLDDFSIHDGKILACSHYQNCVDMWVADILLIEPHRVGGAPLSFGTKEQNFNIQEGIVKPSTEKHTSPHAYEATEYRNIYVDIYGDEDHYLKRARKHYKNRFHFKFSKISSEENSISSTVAEKVEITLSLGVQASGLRYMTFHPDGCTIFCGLDDNLKIFSWEPIKCHNVVDMWWSTLDHLSIHDGSFLFALITETVLTYGLQIFC